MHDYEMFVMNSTETIADMFARFSKIVNNLKGFGKAIEVHEQVKKILRSLPKNWNAKVTAIEEAKDLAILTMDQLIGSLMTHEITLKKNEEDEFHGKKSIALKADSLCDSSDDTGMEDDVAMLTKRIRRIITRNKKDNKPRRRFQGSLDKQKKSVTKNELPMTEEIRCYRCKGFGHIQSACPNARKDKMRKKKTESFGAWCDSASSVSLSSESENEEAKVCFMADEESEVNSSTPSYDEFYSDENEIYDDLLKELEILGEKY